MEIPHNSDLHEEYWIWGSYHKIHGQMKLVYLVEDISKLEVPPSKYAIIMFIVVLCASLMIGLLLVFLHKKTRVLVSPLVTLSQQLRHDKGEHLEPLVIEGVTTQETHQLLKSVNDYREQIKQLIERERMFTRYASHELRTPLTVVKGVASLLGERVERLPALETAREEVGHVAQELRRVLRQLASPAEVDAHDAVEPVGFVFRREERVIGMVSDSGHVTPAIRERLREAQVLFVEANYDWEVCLAPLDEILAR